MPLLSIVDIDKSLKLNELLCKQLSPFLNTTNTNLLNAQLNLITAESILNSTTNKPTSYSRYKTELCRQFSENGQCKYGDKCQFAHGLDELKDVKRHPKYKTDFCKTFHSKGFCPYGPRCHFIHDLNEKFELTPGLPQPALNKNVKTTTPSVKLIENQLDQQLTSIQNQLTSSLLLNIKTDTDEERNRFTNLLSMQLETPIRTRSSVSSTSSNYSSASSNSNESSSSSTSSSSSSSFFNFYTEHEPGNNNNNFIDLNNFERFDSSNDETFNKHTNKFNHQIIW